MTNKIKLVAAMVFTIALITFSAFAHAEPKLYVGTEYQHTQFDEVGGQDSFHAGQIHVGAKLTDHVGVEAGVAQSGTETLAGTKIDLQTYNVDLVGYMPVADKLNLLATSGVMYTIADGVALKSEQEWGYAIGTGLEYSLTDSVSLRGLVRYEMNDLVAVGSDSAYKTAVGLNYSF